MKVADYTTVYTKTIKHNGDAITLTVGARAKEGKGGGEGEKKNLFSLPAPSALPLTRPISSSLREVSPANSRALKENACTAGNQTHE